MPTPIAVALSKSRPKLSKAIFTVVSAIIVLMTFAVNEGLRAKASESASSMDRANTTFLLISSGISNAPKIDRIQEEMTEILSSLRNATESEKIPSGALEWQGAAYKNFQDALANEKRLAEAAKLQSDQEYQVEIAKIGDDLEKDSKYMNTAFRFNAAVDRHDTVKIPALKRELQSLATEESPGNFRFKPTDAEIAKEIDSLGAYLLKRTEEERTDSEGLAKKWTMASYFLYPLGVGIGLVGKLFGNEVAIPEG